MNLKGKNKIRMAIVSMLVASLGLAFCNVGRAQDTVQISMSVWGMPWENKLYTQILIPQFEEKYPGIKVKFYHFDMYNPKLDTLFAGGELPDVIRVELGHVPRQIVKGMLLPLDEYIAGPDKVDKNDFIPVCWNAATWEDKLYALPQDINFRGLFYNKDLFNEAGLEYPNYEWTWDDLLKVSKKFAKPEQGMFAIAPWWHHHEFHLLFTRAGGRFYDDQGTVAQINSPAGLLVMDFLRKITVEFHLAPSTTERAGIGPDKLFEMGMSAMLIDGMWRPPSIATNAPDLDFAVIPFPKVRKNYEGIYEINHLCLFGVTTQSKHPKEAYLLARDLTGTEAGVPYWKQTWVGPPARWSNLKDPYLQSYKEMGIEGVVAGMDSQQEFEDMCRWIFDIIEGKAGPLGETHASLWYESILGSRLASAMELVAIGEASPQEALDKAAREINEAIAEEIKVMGR